MAQTPRILICDHGGEGLAALRAALARSGCEIEVSESLLASRERLRAGGFDALVLDPLATGGRTELEELDRLRAGAALLVLVDPRDPLRGLLAAHGLAGGPWDLVHRGAPLDEVLLRIARLREQRRELEELDEMRYRAVHDDRTGLLRPRPFEERLREHFSAAQRHRLEMAFVLLDLDGFGRVNKEHDHTVGDRVIARVGAVIGKSLRAEDVGGRLGGDEFAVVLPYTNRVDAARVVQRLRDEVRSISGPLDGTGGSGSGCSAGSAGRDGRERGANRRELTITASLGFETFDGRDLESVETLRRRAEVALRWAKDSGGDRGVYYRSLETGSPGASGPAEAPRGEAPRAEAPRADASRGAYQDRA